MKRWVHLNNKKRWCSVVEKHGNVKPVLLNWRSVSATNVVPPPPHKFLCCYIKYGDAFMWWCSIKLSEKVEERRCFTSEINNCFSRRFMAKLCAWQHADSQDRAVGRRLGFSAVMMVVLWSNLCLWNYPPRAVGLISSKVRATTGSTEIAWLLRGSQAFLFLIPSAGVGTVFHGPGHH